VRKVEPVYPAFARAIGLEGVVRFEIAISTSGRIYTLGMINGPPSLQQAAQHAISQYVYRPFEEDGGPINVATTVDVAFKLGEDVRKMPAYPAQKMAMDNFAGAADVLTALSPKLRRWRQSQSGWCGIAEECLHSLNIFELPVKKTGVRLYFVILHSRGTCGGTGNCVVEIVGENANGVHPFLAGSGWGFYAHFRPGSLYPDIFIPSHMSAFATGVAGYVNAGGTWGLLYCGSIGAEGTADIHVCR